MPRKRALAMFVKSALEKPRRKCTVGGQCFCDGSCYFTQLDAESADILERNRWGMYVYSSGGDQMGPIERAIKEGTIANRFKGYKAEPAWHENPYKEDGHWSVKVKGKRKGDSWAWIGDESDFRYESWNEAKLDADFFNEWASS